MVEDNQHKHATFLQIDILSYRFAKYYLHDYIYSI